jgi:LuxR family maltose regulon positive regulatory protein
MNPSTLLQRHLLATKFFLPSSPGMLIPRSHLHALLNKSLDYPFTLVSAPAGFGKTTLLSTWAQALAAPNTGVCWLSLDEEDNDPYLFWIYVLSALQTQDPQHFAPLLTQLQSPSPPPLKSLLTQLTNLLVESTHRFVLILDDYHVITEEQVHTTLASLMEHQPDQLCLILATRADPPLPIPVLRARQKAWEIRTEQLRCTSEETRTFFQDVVGIHLSDQTILEVRSRMEGWLVGLHLLGLSLPEHVDPLTLLDQVSGEQRYILDYLTEVVLQKQPPEVQRFLLCTSLLEQLNASLCDAVMEQTNSHAMLEYLERANLFVVSLDHQRQWYRYHALFAETLTHQLQQNHADLVPILHYRACCWYAQHQQMTLAILHAFQAKEWHWAADLIEGVYPPLVSFTWGANRYALVQLREWMEQLPAEILASRPHFCLACVHLLWAITPHAVLFTWLDLAQMALETTLKEQKSVPSSQGDLSSPEQRDQLGKVLTLRSFLYSFTEDGPTTFALAEQALALLSPENISFRAIVALAKCFTSYSSSSSSANDAVAAITYGYQAALLAQEAKQPVVTLCMMALTVIYLIGAGRLHQAEQLIQQAFLSEMPSSSPHLPEVGWMMILQAEIVRERNDLASARALVTEAIALCEQSVALASLPFLIWGYAMLIRVCLSCGDVDGARTFLQQAEQIGRVMNQQVYLYDYSCFTIVDQVRLWLAGGELERATRWAEQLDVMSQQHLTSFARERQAVAQTRILLAKEQPLAALQRLEPALQRATAGQRWGHVLEIHLLQALAHQKLHEEAQALAALSEAIRLGEPEGYIRSFVEEGTPMEVLLSQLRKKCAKQGPTPYLDTLQTAFQQESKTHQPVEKLSQSQHQESKAHQPVEKLSKSQHLPEPLSERERQVLQLLAQGRSNQEIAQVLVIALDTVKRHVSHVFSKLGVTNRVQAVKQAHDLGLLDEQS